MDVRDGLEDAGAAIVGPAYTVTQAMALAAHAKISAAVLDMRLGRESVGPVARVLAERGIPFVFYSGQINTDPLRVEWPAAPLVSKPASARQLVRILAALLRR
jgi:DNA-binding response OmpR family regulator